MDKILSAVGDTILWYERTIPKGARFALACATFPARFIVLMFLFVVVTVLEELYDYWEN